MNADELERLISRLESLPEASRPVDGHIAVLVGFEKRTVDVIDPKTGDRRTHVQWVSPSGECPATVPSYTADIDAAFQLAQALAPGVAGGCSWTPEGGTALIEGAEACEASTPAIALCMAAIKFKMAQGTRA
ncbi:hypothetical protein SM0020_12175 [Sinorhizobium meliloti CCNWSX0020]|uniref:Phage ABA sandwich domain-containing protein n=1 Tax=Sinorhizobium meliloti CCNWSX0020 TaxID=1107881 RepID=H0FZ01_RHIML|nr:hypothetical protein [Sinorhizobium meliloti]EHK77681.1 hypothetical protein SM0020_12175 [Sinorhizobium meliloti CCNWSX0020]